MDEFVVDVEKKESGAGSQSLVLMLRLESSNNKRLKRTTEDEEGEQGTRSILEELRARLLGKYKRTKLRGIRRRDEALYTTSHGPCASLGQAGGRWAGAQGRLRNDGDVIV